VLWTTMHLHVAFRGSDSAAARSTHGGERPSEGGGGWVMLWSGPRHEKAGSERTESADGVAQREGVQTKAEKIPACLSQRANEETESVYLTLLPPPPLPQ
jgi:hypothetical protein